MVVIDYFSQEFEKLRKNCELDDDLLSEIFFNFDNINKCKNIENLDGGKSDSYIFITYNRQFVIKIITNSEKLFLLEILPDYFSKVFGGNESKLIKIYGLIEIIPEKINVIIMENLVEDRENYLIFDLKGSLVNRKIETGNVLEPGIVLKDQNFLESSLKIIVQKENKIISVLANDFEFLMKHKIIDYSLLIAIPFNEIEKKKEIVLNDRIIIGIIDITEKYSIKKASEKAIKSLVYKSINISAADPSAYGERITKFLFEIFRIT